MKQKVIFVSWSGKRSLAIANALSDWLRNIFPPGITFWISPEMDRGTRWFSEISRRLEECDFGIVCLTPDNLEAQWIHFEAGALSKTEDSRVCTYLWKLTPMDVTGPLSQFNHASADMDGTKMLLATINGAVSVWDAPRLDILFDQWWPKLQDTLEQLELDGEREPDTRTKSRELADRNAYIMRFYELIESATREVLISTSQFQRTGQLAEASLINQAIRKARDRDVRVQIMLATGYDRLPGAIELSKQCHADVRFDPSISDSDINWICCDGSRIILASRPTDHTQQYRRSLAWFELESKALVAQTRQHFLRRWDELAVRTLSRHLQEVLPGIEEGRLHEVAANLGLSPDELNKYRNRKTLLLLLVGRPGSGKTTLIRRIQEHLRSAGLGRAICLSDLPYIQRVFGTASDEGSRFKRTEDGGFVILDEEVYEEALNRLSEQALSVGDNPDILILEFARREYRSAVQALVRKGLKPDLIVYLKVTLETALSRNRHRRDRTSGDNHYTSEEELRAYFGTDDIDGGSESFPVKLKIIDNENDSAASELAKAREVISNLLS